VDKALDIADKRCNSKQFDSSNKAVSKLKMLCITNNKPLGSTGDRMLK
jgi:hypothetical protein